MSEQAEFACFCVERATIPRPVGTWPAPGPGPVRHRHWPFALVDDDAADDFAALDGLEALVDLVESDPAGDHRIQVELALLGELDEAGEIALGLGRAVEAAEEPLAGENLVDGRPGKPRVRVRDTDEDDGA